MDRFFTFFKYWTKKENIPWDLQNLKVWFQNRRMKHKRQAVNGSVNKDAASKVSDTIRQIIRGTKEKREKKDKEIAEAALISRENSHGSIGAGVTNIMLPASAATAKSSSTTSKGGLNPEGILCIIFVKNFDIINFAF